jgi:hypothetical protein
MADQGDRKISLDLAAAIADALGVLRTASPGSHTFDPLPGSPRVGHRWPRMVRGRCPEPESNHRVGNGGQGRTDSRSESGQRSCPKGEDRRRPIRVNRTIDTRIFSSSERAVRCGKAEEAERDFAGPTEPPRPTEPIPNPGPGRRPSHAVSSRSARTSAHRDRTRTEPWPLDPVGLTAVLDRRILHLTRRSRHAHPPPPVKRTHRSNSPPVWVHSRAISDRDVARTLARRRASLHRLPSPRPIRVSHRPIRARPVGSQKSQRFAQ